MGFLDKLFGSNVADKIKNAAETVAKEATNAVNAAANPNSAASNARPASAAPAPSSSGAESGFSWGPTMPAEENQYSFSGSYLAYFDMVFSQEFPQYRITRETPKKGHSTIYSFWLGERKALVAELMSERSEANKLRSECRARHIPYVRFYYDHDGWWNTRSYVAQRTRAALEGRL